MIDRERFWRENPGLLEIARIKPVDPPRRKMTPEEVAELDAWVVRHVQSLVARNSARGYRLVEPLGLDADGNLTPTPPPTFFLYYGGND